MCLAIPGKIETLRGCGCRGAGGSTLFEPGKQFLRPKFERREQRAEFLQRELSYGLLAYHRVVRWRDC